MRARWLALLVLAAAAGAVAWWWHPSDEAAIRAVLDHVASTVSTSAEDADLARLAQVAALGGDFADDVVVELGGGRQALHGRESVLAAATRLSGSVHALDLRFVDVAVTIDPGGTSALVSTTAEVRSMARGRTANELDARELEIGFARRNDRWIIASLAVVSAIEPVQP